MPADSSLLPPWLFLFRQGPVLYFMQPIVSRVLQSRGGTAAALFLTYLKAAVKLHQFSFLLTGCIGMGQVMSITSLEMWMCKSFNRLESHFNTSSSPKLILIFLKVISFMTQIAVCPIKPLFSPKKRWGKKKVLIIFKKHLPPFSLTALF